MKLLNCKRCDDVVKLVDIRTRTCECGAASGKLEGDERATVTGPARVFVIRWEDYDGAMPGERKAWSVEK